jgi:hypothetical protein
MNNMEGAFAKNAVKGIASGNPLAPRRGMLKNGVKGKKETPAKPLKVKSTRVVDEPGGKLPPRNVKSERVTKEEPQRTGPRMVKSVRVDVPQETGPRAISAPPPKKDSKPRKPRDVKYTQPALPGMRNKRQFKGKNGKA